MSPKCAFERRAVPPGQRSQRRRKVTERGAQLLEKQKARHIYGVLERQFRRYLGQAERQPGLLGENLLILLERRMDNVVYRLGFADSRRQGRQLVRHGHFSVNGRKLSIPSAVVKPGDVIAWAEGSTKLEYYKTMIRGIQSKSVPGWLSLDMQTLSARVLSLPARSDVEIRLDEREIVAYYTR